MSQTLLIIIVTAAISIYALNERNVIGKLIMDPILVKHGQYYRLLTSGFIHADYQHLFFNMLTLYFFGGAMEGFFNIKGGYIYLLVYLMAIVISSLPAYFKNRNNTHYLSLGASGGVSAILFSFILLQPWTIMRIWFVPCPAIIFGIIYMGYSWYMNKQQMDNIGHDAHLSGAIFGLLATLVIEPRVLPYFLNSLMHPQFNF